MCGIVGYIGAKEAAPLLIDGLKRLEYRGYDSAGIAVFDGRNINIVKAKGKLSILDERIDKQGTPRGTLGIGHTRWATHGKPSDTNAHPHNDCSGDFVVVHNGIIENYKELRERLKARGHTFNTECDTEVIAHLIEENYNGDLVEAVQRMLSKIKGSFALGIISKKEPNKIVGARKDSPLIVGIGCGENFIASDIPAILSYTRDIYILEDGEMVVLTDDKIDIMNFQGNRVEKEVFHVDWDAVAAEKGGYPHFMLKEIHEQPKALKDTMTGRIDVDNVKIKLDDITITEEDISKINKINIVACGTAYHAGIVGKYTIEKLARIPVEVDIASEFRYRDPMVDENTLVIIISQSGETADTLAALRESRKRGARILAITNVVGSSVAREAQDVLYTWAGPEIAVASTKAYTTQLVSLYMLALDIGLKKGTLSRDEALKIMQHMKQLPEQVQTILKNEDKIKELAEKYSTWEDVFFIGRSLDYAVAMEGSLKLKEISYVHAEAYAAGELKHGTLALIVDGIPVIALATQDFLYEKMMSNIEEVKARGGTIIALVKENDKKMTNLADHIIPIPDTLSLLTPVLTVIPLQLLAYYTAAARGCDIDKPRNLAKSVTVE